MPQYNWPKIYDEQSDELLADKLKPDFFLESRQPSIKELDRKGEIVLYISSSCNGDCLYCYAGSHKKGKSMGFSIAKAAIDNVSRRHKKINVVFFGEGEPTLAFPLIKQILEYLRHKKKQDDLDFSTHLISNGLFNRKKAEWIFENIDEIAISCDGPADMHNITRRKINGGPSHSLLEENIKFFIARSPQKIKLKAVINPFSVKRQTEILEYFYRLGYRRETLFTPFFDCPKSRVNKLKPVGDEFMDNFLKAREISDYLDFGINLVTDLTEIKPKAAMCGLSRSNFYVTTGGAISCCVRALEDSKSDTPFFYGEIKDGRVIINSKKDQALKKRTVNNIKDCGRCFLKWVCAGGCVFQHFEKMHDLMKIDKEICEKRKNEVKKYLLFEARRASSDLRPFFLVKKRQTLLSLWSGAIPISEKENPLIEIDPFKDNLQSIFKKIKKHRDQRGFKPTIFFLRFLSYFPSGNKEIGREILRFLGDLNKERIHFKLTRPLPGAWFNNRADIDCLEKEFGMPKNMSAALDLFKVKGLRIFFGDIDSGLKLDDFKSRKALAALNDGKNRPKVIK